jgi:molybdopterin-synthase adenylyltransferase
MIGPLTVPGKTTCYWCARNELNRRSKSEHLIKASEPGTRAGEPSMWLPAMPPRQAMAAGVAVWEAVRFLSGMDCPPSLRGVISINALDWVGYKL